MSKFSLSWLTKKNLEFEKKTKKQKNSMLGSVKVPGLQHMKISANLDE